MSVDTRDENKQDETKQEIRQGGAMLFKVHKKDPPLHDAATPT